MTNNLNTSKADMAKIKALTADELKAVRRNIQERAYSDEETREALLQACADGHEVEDFLA